MMDGAGWEQAADLTESMLLKTPLNRRRLLSRTSSVLSPSREDSQRAQLQHMYFTQRAQHIQANAKLLETLIEIAHQKDVRMRFGRWAGLVRLHHEQEVAVRYNLERKAGQTERVLWDAWQRFAADSKWIKLLLNRQDVRRRRHMLYVSFTYWHVAWHRQDRLTAQKILNNMRTFSVKKLMRMAFTRLRAAVVYTHRFRANYLYKRCLVRLNGRSTCIAFEGWKTLCQGSSRRAVIIARALGRIQSRAVGASFEAWWMHSTEQKTQKSMLRKALNKINNLALTSAFQSWGGHAGEAKRQQVALARIMAKMMNGALAGGFATWVEWMAETKQHNVVVKRMLQKLLNRCLGMVFSAWVETAQGRKKLQRIVNQIVNKKLSAAFLSWQTTVSLATALFSQPFIALPRVKLLPVRPQKAALVALSTGRRFEAHETGWFEGVVAAAQAENGGNLVHVGRVHAGNTPCIAETHACNASPMLLKTNAAGDGRARHSPTPTAPSTLPSPVQQPLPPLTHCVSLLLLR